MPACEDTQIRMYATEKIERAIAKRAALRRTGTTAYRIVDGDGDELPGLVIDDFNGNWLVGVKREEKMPDLSAALGFRSLYGKILTNEGKQAPVFLAGDPVTTRFSVQEHGLAFWVDFQAGYSQGIFLDQRINRERLRTISSGKTVLNTYAYTCAFGVAAASGGARTTNLDLSRAYLEWGRANYLLNGLDSELHEFIYGDVFQWLKRFAKRGRRFDVVILDPPTFSRDRDGGIFRMDTDFGDLLDLALSVVSSDGQLLCCTNARGISHTLFAKMLRAKLPNIAAVAATRMPEDFPGSDYLKSFWVELSH